VEISVWSPLRAYYCRGTASRLRGLLFQIESRLDKPNSKAWDVSISDISALVDFETLLRKAVVPYKIMALHRRIGLFDLFLETVTHRHLTDCVDWICC
jgi:hypothetical protein